MLLAAWMYLHVSFPSLWFCKYSVYNATGGVVCGCIINSGWTLCLLVLIIP